MSDFSSIKSKPYVQFKFLSTIHHHKMQFNHSKLLWLWVLCCSASLNETLFDWLSHRLLPHHCMHPLFMRLPVCFGMLHTVCCFYKTKEGNNFSNYCGHFLKSYKIIWLVVFDCIISRADMKKTGRLNYCMETSEIEGNNYNHLVLL